MHYTAEGFIIPRFIDMDLVVYLKVKNFGHVFLALFQVHFTANGPAWTEHMFVSSTLKDFGMGKIKLISKIVSEMTDVILDFESSQGDPYDPKIITAFHMANNFKV